MALLYALMWRRGYAGGKERKEDWTIGRAFVESRMMSPSMAMMTTDRSAHQEKPRVGLDCI